MRNLIIVIFIITCFSCNNEKTLLLPEIENSSITEVLDVSPAYIFYDESQSDSSLLNRKNLISTTNWLVNVDKRLKLKQAIPHIIFLQNKKRDAKMHKNENAKNYFTCNDTSIENLGFIEFTEIYYQTEEQELLQHLKSISKNTLLIRAHSNSTATVSIFQEGSNLIELKKEKVQVNEQLTSYIKELNVTSAILIFDSQLTFQQYIDVKQYFIQDLTGFLQLSNTEFIY